MNWKQIVVAILQLLTILFSGRVVQFSRLLKEIGELSDNPSKKELQDVVDALKALLGR